MPGPDVGILNRELKRIYDADAALRAAGWPELYSEEAPRGIARPYAVLIDIGNTILERSSDSEFTVNRFQFNFYGGTRATVLAGCRLTRAAFRLAGDSINLAPEGEFKQLRYVATRALGPDENIWQGVLEYDLYWAEVRGDPDG